MSDECAAAQPTREHERLKESAGTWKVDCTFYMDPSQPPMQVEATETIEMLGSFFTVSRFECEFFGAAFQGRATLGYEPQKQRWVGTWIDSMSPHTFFLTGCFDEAQKKLAMTGEGPNPAGEGTATYRSVEAWEGPDQRTFDMYFKPPGGDEVQMMHYVYTRAR